MRESSSSSRAVKMPEEKSILNVILEDCRRRSSRLSKDVVVEKIDSSSDDGTGSISLRGDSSVNPGESTKKNGVKDDRTCQFCQKVFKKPSQMVEHARRHTGERPFACTRCELTFARKSNAAKHKKICKGKTRKKSVPSSSEQSHAEDGNSKSSKKVLRTQTSTSSLEKSCRYCGKKLASVAERLRHERVHTGERPYSCQFCRKSFSWTSGLRRHQTTCCKRDQSTSKVNAKQFRLQISDGASKKKRRSAVQCDYCGKKWKNRSLLRRHVRTHTGERPHKCDYCEAAFSRRYQLTGHLQNCSKYQTTITPVEEPETVMPLEQSMTEEEDVTFWMDPTSLWMDPDLFNIDASAEENVSANGISREPNFKTEVEDLTHMHSTEQDSRTKTDSPAEPHISVKNKTLKISERLFGCKYCPQKFSTKLFAKIHGRNCTSRRICFVRLSRIGNPLKLARNNGLPAAEESAMTSNGTEALEESEEDCIEIPLQASVVKVEMRESQPLPYLPEISRVENENNNGISRYSCNLCGEVGDHEAALASHLRTHVGANIYQCPFCYRRFSEVGEAFLHDNCNDSKRRRRQKQKAKQFDLS